MICVGFKSDRGAIRKNNEDSCFVMPKEHIYMVADGVGGNNAGETASSMAVTTIAEYVKEKSIKKLKSQKDIYYYLNSCVEIANKKIRKCAIENPEHRGMATTLVLCYIRENMAYFANAGDSRAYLYRDKKLFQITEDHSYVNELVKKGALTYEEAINHENSNMITKALGAEATVNADLYQMELKENDLILLCTDGLYGSLEDGEISEAMDYESNMLHLSEILINRANMHNSKDNVTAVCLKVEGGC